MIVIEEWLVLPHLSSYRITSHCVMVRSIEHLRNICSFCVIVVLWIFFDYIVSPFSQGVLCLVWLQVVKMEKNSQVQVIQVILECVYRHSPGGQFSTQQRSSQSISCKSPTLYTSVHTSTYHHTVAHSSTHQYTSMHTIHVSSHEFTLEHISISSSVMVFFSTWGQSF